MKLYITSEEAQLMKLYGIKNFNDLREVFLRTRDSRLMNLYNRSILAISGQSN